jgi:tetratricopeptide (TPR) repeat protein
VARLAACESVIADEKITGPSRAAAFAYRGDSLMKKRDYDGAIAAFSAAHEIAPPKSMSSTRAALPTAYKGDDERALADYDLCLQLRPTFGSAYNNRGLIFMRRGELQRSLDEFNLAVKYVANDQSRYLHHLQPGRRAGIAEGVRRLARRFCRGAKGQSRRPAGSGLPLLTYIRMGRFDDALADCNTRWRRRRTMSTR